MQDYKVMPHFSDDELQKKFSHSGKYGIPPPQLKLQFRSNNPESSENVK
jgi:hypothetical protein